MFDGHLNRVENQMRVAEGQISKLRMDTTDWANRFQAEAMANMSTAGPGVRQKIDGPHGTSDVVDKKEWAVRKLQDGVSKPDFRHWLDIIDSNLDSVHHFQYPEIDLDNLRRFDK